VGISARKRVYYCLADAVFSPESKEKEFKYLPCFYPTVPDLIVEPDK